MQWSEMMDLCGADHDCRIGWRASAGGVRGLEVANFAAVEETGVRVGRMGPSFPDVVPGTQT